MVSQVGDAIAFVSVCGDQPFLGWSDGGASRECGSIPGQPGAERACSPFGVQIKNSLSKSNMTDRIVCGSPLGRRARSWENEADLDRMCLAGTALVVLDLRGGCESSRRTGQGPARSERHANGMACPNIFLLGWRSSAKRAFGGCLGSKRR